MNYQQAIKQAEIIYGKPVQVTRKPRNGFASNNPVPSFLGEINTGKGSANVWWVYRPSVGAPITSPSGQKRVSTTVRLDPVLKQQAKDAGLNLSQLLEESIQAKLPE